MRNINEKNKYVLISLCSIKVISVTISCAEYKCEGKKTIVCGFVKNK